MNDTKFIETLSGLEQKIIHKENDDEVQHSLEDDMHLFFIENCVDVDRDTLIRGQEIVSRVGKMDFSRWCA